MGGCCLSCDVSRSINDWNLEQEALYSVRARAEQAKGALDQIIMSTNPHSDEAQTAVAALARAEKAFRRADAAWRNFIRDRLKHDPSWQVPEPGSSLRDR